MVPGEWPLLEPKEGATRFGCAGLWPCFQEVGACPRAPQDVPLTVVDHLAPHVGVPTDVWGQYAWEGRTIESPRAQMRQHLGVRAATVAAGETLVPGLGAQIVPPTRRPDQRKEAVGQRCRDLRIAPPPPERLERLIRSAVPHEDTRVGAERLHRLAATPPAHRAALWSPAEAPTAALDAPASPTLDRAVLQALRADPGRATLDNLVQASATLERLRALQLPPTLCAGLAPTVLQAYRQRVAVAEPDARRRHAVPLRMPRLAASGLLRGRALTASVGDLLRALVHRLGAKAERKVAKALVDARKRGQGTTGMLSRLAEASLDQPPGVVPEGIFPGVREATLREGVHAWKAPGPCYRAHVQTVRRRSSRSP